MRNTRSDYFVAPTPVDLGETVAREKMRLLIPIPIDGNSPMHLALTIPRGIGNTRHSMAEENELTPKQQDAIIALLNEPNVTKAATTAGVGERTLYRWMTESAFKAELRRLRRESFTQAISMAQRYAPLAMNTLAKISNDPAAPHHARVSASIGMLRFGRESIELDDLAGRIEILEQSAAEAAKR
jgi:hypothetical protein